MDDVTWRGKDNVVTPICLGPNISKRLEIESRLQWNANRKPYMRHQMVAWPMTSRDLERSRSWPRYIWSQISRKRLEIGTWFQWNTNRNPIWGIELSRDRWRHVTLKGQGRDNDIFGAKYLENAWRPTWRAHPSTDFDAKWLKRTHEACGVKIETFCNPWPPDLVPMEHQ